MNYLMSNLTYKNLFIQKKKIVRTSSQEQLFTGSIQYPMIKFLIFIINNFNYLDLWIQKLRTQTRLYELIIDSIPFGSKTAHFILPELSPIYVFLNNKINLFCYPCSQNSLLNSQNSNVYFPQEDLVLSFILNRALFQNQ